MTMHKTAPILVMVGVPGLLAMTGLAFDQPNMHLWRAPGFLGVFAVLAAASLVGVFVFIQDWRERVIAPTLIAVAYALICFSAAPVYIFVALILAFLAAMYWVSPSRIRATTNASADEVRNIEQQRDDALSRESALQAQLKAQYPDFHATIFEIQNQDPVVGPDMQVVLIMEVLNNGAESLAKAFKATALTNYGAIIPIDVFGSDGFRLIVNKGRDCFNYLPEHFIMNRTIPNPVKRGSSVTGILPCIFRGITNPKEVDLRTLKVEFVDAIGTPEKQPKWWSTTPIDGVKWEDPVLKKHRPTLPALEQPCGSGPSNPPISDSDGEKWRQLAPLLDDFRSLKQLTVKLEVFVNEHDTKLAEGASIRDQTLQLQIVDSAFEPLRRDIVRSLAKLKNDYGITSRGAEEWLAGSMLGPGQMRVLAKELWEIVIELQRMVSDRASKLYDV
jgi:hypothetical protein